MKIKLLLAFLTLAASASAQRMATLAELDDRGDVYYIKGTDSLFTGVIEDMTESTNDYMRVEIVQGVANGMFRGYYDAARTVLKFEVPYVNGKKHGRHIYYYENGGISFTVNCKKDKMEGERRCYFDSGELWHIHHYRHDKENGLMQTWYVNGNKHETVHYRNGLKTGLYLKYYENGALRQKGKMKNDRTTGRWREWDQEGNLKADVTYKAGVETERKL